MHSLGGLSILKFGLVLTLVTCGLTLPSHKGQRSRNGHDLHSEVPEQNVFDSQFRQYRYAAVTTDTHVCSQIGNEIMAVNGGSAVDASIAALICVGVVNHHSCGIGGGHFSTIYESPNTGGEKIWSTMISREVAPLAAHQDMFVNNTEASRKGGLSIAVPGEVAGMYAAWQRFGRVDWGLLYEPSITLCEEGFAVPRDLASAVRSYENDIRADPNLSELFVKGNGDLVQEGDILMNMKLGQTLRAIAEDPHTFYTGKLAQDIVDDIAEYGGIITLEDLSSYITKEKDPLNITLHNGKMTLKTPRPPSSGAVISFIMQVLDGYNFSPADIEDFDSKLLTYHKIVESFKFAFAKRTHLGDEDYVDVEDLLRNLTSPIYTEDIRMQINETSTQDIDYYGPTFDIDGHSSMGTAHLNALAPDGGAVALTATINLFFGSNVRGSRTGIMFNDEMDDFSTPGTSNAFGVPASPANYIVPRKMPMSSMAPAIFCDEEGKPVFLTGASGGTRITTSSAFVAINNLWLGRDLLNSTDTPRIHHQLVPNELRIENHMEQDMRDGFLDKNHELTTGTSNAVVGSIRNSCHSTHLHPRNEECIGAISDGRKGGSPDGF